MVFRLDKEKAVQASGVLLRLAPNFRMSRIRLIKLLYLADRKSLEEKSRPITGDRFVAMDHGPVLSGVYDLIKNTHSDPGSWPRHIRNDHNDLVLSSDPAVSELSRYEVRTLEQIFAKYENMDDWDFVEHVLHQLPEWIEHNLAQGHRKTFPYGMCFKQ